MIDKQKLAEAIDKASGPTSTGYTARVIQTGQLGTYALQFNGDHAQFTLYGTLEDFERNLQQIHLDIVRQKDMRHLWWQPEVEA